MLLGRADFIIHNQQIRFHILCQHANLINLAPAQEKSIIRLRLALNYLACHLRSGSLCQPLQLHQGILNAPATGRSIVVHSCQNRPFLPLFSFLQLVAPQLLVDSCHQLHQVVAVQVSYRQFLGAMHHIAAAFRQLTAQKSHAAIYPAILHANSCHHIKAHAAQR